MKKILIILTVLKVIFTTAFDNLVVHSVEKRAENVAPFDPLLHPIVYDMGIESNISNRFAKTLVTSHVKNPSTQAQEMTFTVVLPEKAFISEFILQIGGKEYKAHVKEKEEAKQIYQQAVGRGQTAGHVSVSARDSNKFTVSVNVEPEAKAAFLLTYDELLERKNNQYELVINIHPGQVVDNLHVQVLINESRPLTFVRTPSLRSGNEIDKNNDNLDPSSIIEFDEKKTAVVKFDPDVKQQKQFAKEMGFGESEGLSGQFVVQYDVERDPYGGEVLLQDGYFVHFFAPDDLPPLAKYIVFVLDTSGSMGWGNNKIGQLKDAMKNILDQLKPGDYVSLIEFNSFVYGWNIDNESNSMINLNNYQSPFNSLNVEQIPRPSAVQDQTITKAKNIVNRFHASGGTNIISALEVALATVKLYLNQNQETDKNLQPLVMFLTDGEPVGGISNTDEITRIVTKLNLENNRVPIYSLSFGEGADKEFLRKLSLKNSGFSRHIYDASDASLQLQNFYKEISSPLLSNIKFEYTDAVNVTKVDYPVLYKGSEIIVGGYYPVTPTDFGKIGGICGRGRIILKPRAVETPVSSLERLWAYLTVKQKLDQRDIAGNKEELTKEALDLALKYSFVTDVTSLVVVKPNDTQRAKLETARPDAMREDVQDRIYGGMRPGSSYPPRGWSVYGAPGLSGPPGPPTYHSPISAPRPMHYPSPSYSSYHSYPSPSYSRLSGIYHSPSFSRTSGSHHYSPQVASYPSYGFSSKGQYPSYSHPTPPPYSGPNRIMPPTYLQSSPAIGFVAPTSTSTIRSNQNLEDLLSWLKAALNPDKTLTVKGSGYKIEENYRSSSNIDCPRTPLSANVPGSCKLLKDCPEVYSYLTDFQIYERYFCPVDNAYAGVCCPKKGVPEP